MEITAGYSAALLSARLRGNLSDNARISTQLQSTSISSSSVAGAASSLQARNHLRISVLGGKRSRSRPLRRRFSVPRCSVEEVYTAEKESLVDFANSFSSTGTESGDSGLSEQHTVESSGSKFNWVAQWYPVCVLKHMDKRQPHAVTILGRDLVVWWDSAGKQWQVFEDSCPHRLAPLSEGRIDEQGRLQCSYHGWAFAPTTGACTLIPQTPKDQIQGTYSKRACAKVYLSQHHEGLLWVYLDRSEGAKERATANPPPSIPALSDPDFCYDLALIDMVYSYETLIENVLDPSHVPFAHHSVQGNRNKARPLDYKVENFGKEGFSGRGDMLTVKFAAPTLVSLETTLPPPKEPQGHPWALKLRDWIISKKSTGGKSKEMQVWGVFFCVPVASGKSKLFMAFPRNFAKFIFDLTPRWLGHQVQMKVIDGDGYFLHVMERRIEDGGGMENVGKLFYTPTRADAFVVSCRRWLKKFGVPDLGLRASDRLPLSPPKTTILDRYSLHVANCTICLSALRRFKALELVLHVLPFMLVGLVAASNAKPLHRLNSFSIPLICLAVVSSLASRWLSYWIKKHFEFHDYNHALVK